MFPTGLRRNAEIKFIVTKRADSCHDEKGSDQVALVSQLGPLAVWLAARRVNRAAQLLIQHRKTHSIAAGLFGPVHGRISGLDDLILRGLGTIENGQPDAG